MIVSRSLVPQKKTYVVSFIALLLLLGLGITLMVNQSKASAVGETYIDLMEKGLATGLYPTGVTVSTGAGGTPVTTKSNALQDQNWTLDGIFRTGGLPGSTCQWGYNGSLSGFSSGSTTGRFPSNSSQYFPTRDSNFPAQIITETQPNGIDPVFYTDNHSMRGAGYISDNFPAITGINQWNTSPGMIAMKTYGPWGVTNPGASWIGQNRMGHNTSRTDCLDPSYGPATTSIGVSNVYVFKLTNGFNIDSSVNLDSLELHMRAFVDNQLRVYVNGRHTDAGNTQLPMRVSGDDGYSLEYIQPGFHPGTPTVESQALGDIPGGSGSILKKGPGAANKNDLYIYVRSNYGFTGLMIPEITLRMPVTYELKPAVAATTGVVSVSEDISGGRTVRNDTSVASSTDTVWQSKRVVYSPTASIPGPGNSSATANACSYFGGSCESLGDGTGPIAANSTLNAGSITTQVPDVPVGSRVCITMSVKNRSGTAAEWAHDIKCWLVGKSPKVQIQGGDVVVGRAIPGSADTSVLSTSRIETSLTNKSTGTFGSWVEYSALAPSRIVNFASGAGLSGVGADSSQGSWSKLSYANQPSSGTDCASSSQRFGCYSPQATIMPAIAASFAGAATGTPISGTVNVSALAKNRVVGTSGTGDIVLQGATFGKSQWLVVYAPTRNVRIAGDMRYTNDPLVSAADIPQLIIIANNISVDAGVTNVDAWLVARGNVVTCTGQETAALSSAVCGNALRVNGPVLANKLYLRRTAGSGAGAASGDPAETFNLRADAYIWATNHSASSDVLRSTQYSELPPRF